MFSTPCKVATGLHLSPLVTKTEKQNKTNTLAVYSYKSLNHRPTSNSEPRVQSIVHAVRHVYQQQLRPQGEIPGDQTVRKASCWMSDRHKAFRRNKREKTSETKIRIFVKSSISWHCEAKGALEEGGVWWADLLFPTQSVIMLCSDYSWKLFSI